MASISEVSISAPRRTALVWHQYRVDILWWCFVAINAWAMLVLSVWATVPFHFIWIGVSLMYGWRVWTMRVTFVSLSVIVVVTGAMLLDDVFRGTQAPDELTEIPLMAAVFLVMVHYVRRSAAAQQETARVAAHNLALVEQSRTLVQNASHVLRTPLTIALGHAELLERTATGPETVDDARVVVDELNRLTKVTDRFLGLAKSEQPDFLSPVETAVGDLVMRTATRWMATHPPVSLGVVVNEVMSVDPDRLAEAIDEMIGNAVVHCPPGTPVEVSAGRRAGRYVISVADRGAGIPASMTASVFERFSHGTGTSRRGAGLGLAIVKAITEGHGGTVRVRSREGGGTVLEMALP
ncbi:MAG: HAMP domain-containing histidine kinase [Nocardioides sp.]|nr:HAMP domain-containing histidine kinase [Nocardioides sp.]